MKIKLLPLLFFPLLFLGCNSSSVKHDPFTDTPTSGEINILCDESYQPLIQVQIDTFMEIYKYANIHVKYLPETELFKALFASDSFRIAIVSRELTLDEKTIFDNQKIVPRTTKVAEDAIALVVNKNNPDTIISYEQLESIIRGDIVTWKQLYNSGIKDSLRIVFDKSGSANARFLNDRFLKGRKFPPNIFATKSNSDVVSYVSENAGSIGIIGVNWISDKDDSLTGSFLKKISVVSISLPDTGKKALEFNKPYQAYIALKKYPLLRDVVIISREGRNGLGTGFASFVAGDKGQRLIRLMGLLPATMPVRIIQVN